MQGLITWKILPTKIVSCKYQGLGVKFFTKVENDPVIARFKTYFKNHTKIFSW
jgi:hypothetical protein